MRIYRSIAEDVRFATPADLYRSFTLSELKDHWAIEAAQARKLAPPIVISAQRPPAPSHERYRSMVLVEAARAKVSPEAIFGISKTRPVAYARFRVWRELRELGFSLPGIGRVAGRKHETILSGIRRINKVEPACRLANVLGL